MICIYFGFRIFLLPPLANRSHRRTFIVVRTVYKTRMPYGILSRVMFVICIFCIRRGTDAFLSNVFGNDGANRPDLERVLYVFSFHRSFFSPASVEKQTKYPSSQRYYTSLFSELVSYTRGIYYALYENMVRSATNYL